MRLSIIIPFLNSYELVRRQILHFGKIDVPRDVEILFMDDGSIPPIAEDPGVIAALETMKGQLDGGRFQIIPTNDFRPWTSSIARNTAAKMAKAPYFLMTDGDYIVSREAIDHGREFTGDRQGFRRHFGVLDENGDFTQDWAVLMSYGLSEEYLKHRGTKITPHPNNFILRKEVFFSMGGYDEEKILTRPYPQGEDRWLKRRWIEHVRNGKAHEEPIDNRPNIYMIPNGQYCGDVDFNPMDQHGKPLLHTLTRKTDINPWFLRKGRFPMGDQSRNADPGAVHA